jgi:hypothetical protein
VITNGDERLTRERLPETHPLAETDQKLYIAVIPDNTTSHAAAAVPVPHGSEPG